ncbi:MAG: LuxR C-terminal-related transcriptional regulator, partial [Rhodobacterales bacterium]|nr:LuxR C-terminal-related transcriptional regulator [Rhodobacterales bacterium]MDX5413901.1 LuxR C-terminal-related transcriptional regulator [Rhodobacterales bacterium]
TETELFILRLAAEGFTNKQIANDINQNETAIKMYMRSICSKLNARNRAHAAMIGRDLGLLAR